MRPPAQNLLLRDLRKQGWSWFEDELFDVFAPLLGPYPVAVYLCLCKLAKGRNPEVEVSLRSLEDLWRTQGYPPSLSKTSIFRALKLLTAAGIIRELSPATNRRPARYGLVSLHNLALEMRVEQCDNLAMLLDHQRRRICGNPDNDPALSGVPQGTADPVCISSGKACVNVPISTVPRGTLEVPTETPAVPGGNSGQLIGKKVISKKTPPTPAERGCSRYELLEVADPAPAFAEGPVPIRQCWMRALSSVYNQLLDAPSRGHLASGLDDWQRYFKSLALVGCAPTTPYLTLDVHAAIPSVALAGFAKYRRRWDAAILDAFGFPVVILVQPAAKEAAHA